MEKSPQHSMSQLQQWYRYIKNEHMRAMSLKKYKEAAWRGCFYLFIVIYGIVVLWDKPWFWNQDFCWIDWINQQVTMDIKIYYWLSLGHYLHLLVAQFFDVKRKDFIEMFIHHIVTVALLSLSYWINYVRIGTLVLLVHDVADIFLEFAKVFNYQKWETLTNITFGLFAVVFGVSRLYIFPFYVIWTVYHIAPTYLTMQPAWYGFTGLLMALQALHIFWYSIVIHMLYKLATGQMKGDERSDSESDGEKAFEAPSSSQSTRKQVEQIEQNRSPSARPQQRRKARVE